MAFDGQAETDAIIAKLKTLVGGRVFETVPNDTVLATMLDGSGDIRPYIVVVTGDPIPKRGDRTIMGERKQVFVLPVSVASVAGDAESARNTSAAVGNLLIDWRPAPSASDMVPFGGYSFTEKASGVLPERVTRTRRFTSDVNLSVT